MLPRLMGTAVKIIGSTCPVIYLEAIVKQTFTRLILLAAIATAKATACYAYLIHGSFYCKF